MNIFKSCKEAGRIRTEIESVMDKFGEETRLFPKMSLREISGLTRLKRAGKHVERIPNSYVYWCAFGSDGGCYFNNELVLYPLYSLDVTEPRSWKTWKCLDSEDEPGLNMEDGIEIGFFKDGTKIYASGKTGVVILCNENEETIIAYDSFSEFMETMWEAYAEYESVLAHIYRIFGEQAAKLKELREEKCEEEKGNAEGCADPESIPAAG